MYSVYIKNYKDSNNQIHTSEEQMYEVPILEPERALTDPSGSVEMGKAGSFEASIKPGQIWYDCWLQMKTLIRVEYEDETIFRGRVLTIDNTLTGEKKLHFEGDLAFLLDSLQHGEKEADRSEISAGSYITELLEEHNRQMLEQGDDDKCIYPGEIPGQYSNKISNAMRLPNERKKFGSDGWQTTMDCLEELQNEFGGYFRTRYTAGTCYFDWLESWFNEEINPQPIKIGENLVSLSSSAEVENIFTALIPVGRDEGNDVLLDQKRILVPQVVSYYSGHPEKLNFGYHTTNDYATAVQKYGIIYKTQKFENADTKAKLLEYAMDWIRNNYCGGVVGFTVSAVDLHHLGLDVRKYLVGDRIRLTYPDIDNRADGVTPMVTKDLTIVSISYNIHNPERNSYTIGTPNNVITRTYGTPVTKAQPTSTPSSTSTASTTTPTSSSSSSSKQAAQQQQEQKQQSYNAGVTNKEVDDEFWNILMDPTHNTAAYNEYKTKYGDKAGEAAIKTAYILLNQNASQHKKQGTTSESQPTTLDSFVIDSHKNRIEMYDTMMPVEYGEIAEQIQLPANATMEQKEAAYKAVASWIIEATDAKLSVYEKIDRYGLQYLLDEGLTPAEAQEVMFLKRTFDGTKGCEAVVMYAYNVAKSGDLETSSHRISTFAFESNNGSLATHLVGVGGNSVNGVDSLLEGLELPGVAMSSDGNQLFTTDGTNSVVTTLVDGVNSVLEGHNPLTGALTTKSDFLNGFFSMFTGNGSGTDSDKTVEIDGKNGTQKIGKDLNGDWEITINEPVAYREWDEEKQAYVVHYTPKGTIKASDFSIPTIPSFHTKFAVVDQLIADKIDANEVRANYAQFNDLTANNIVVMHPNNDNITDAQAWLLENAGDIDATATLLAEKIVAYEGHFHNLDTDMLDVKGKLTAEWIQAKLADLDYVFVNGLSWPVTSTRMESLTSLNLAMLGLRAKQEGSTVTLQTTDLDSGYEGAGRKYFDACNFDIVQGINNQTVDNLSVRTDSNGGTVSMLSLSTGVKNLRLLKDNNSNHYELQAQYYNSGDNYYTISGGTFSLASTLVGEWRGTNSSRYYYVYAEEDSDIHISSPTISADDVYIVGDPVWSSNKQSFTQSMRLDDEDGNTVILFSHEFDTSESYEAGVTYGSTHNVTLTGEWRGTNSSRYYRVYVEGNSSIYYDSPYIDADEVYVSGDPIWSNDKQSFTQWLRIDDEDGNTIVLFSHEFDTSESYEAGVAYGAANVTLNGEWRGSNSSRYYRVYVDGNSSIHYDSPVLDSDEVYTVGDPVWSNDKQSFTQSMRLDDEEGNTVLLFSHEFDTSESYEAGVTYGSTHNVTLSGEWRGSNSSRYYRVSVDGNSSIHYDSPVLDSDEVYTVGDPIWSNDKQSFTQRLRLDDEEGNTVLLFSHTFDTSDSYEAGYNTAESENEATIESLQAQVETLQENLDRATDLCYQYASTIADLNADKRDLQAELDALYDDYDQLDAECQSAWAEYYAEVEQHEIDNSNYQDAIDERNATIASMQETINELYREINSWNGVKHWGSFKLYYQNGYNMVVAGGSANNGVHDWYYFE